MNYKFKTKPYKHQLDALEASWDKENFAYFMEMGTGKSKVLLDNAAMLYDKGQINGLLLIAPKGVYKNWYDQEVPVHLPDHIQKKMVLWKSSDKSKTFSSFVLSAKAYSDTRFSKKFVFDSTDISSIKSNGLLELYILS